MIKFLFQNFRDFPGVGTPIKIAYIGYLVKGVVKEGKRGSSAKDLQKLTGNELEDALNNEANEIFDEYIMSEIKQYNIPEAVIKQAKEKAIEQIVGKLREIADKKVDEKLADKEEPKTDEKVDKKEKEE